MAEENSSSKPDRNMAEQNSSSQPSRNMAEQNSSSQPSRNMAEQNSSSQPVRDMAEQNSSSQPKHNPKVFRATKKIVSRVPSEISNDPELIKAMSVLPQNYNFEIPKTIWQIKKSKAQCVALQFPEGLLMYSLAICDIIEEFTGAFPIIMGDVAYGACCVDDFTASELGADFMVHYGHSCLIPVNETDRINVLYVDVDIKIDTLHIIQTIEKNFDKSITLALISTIQFVSSLQQIASDLKSLEYKVEIPQCKPLSPGEVLGCTSPKIKNAEIVIFIGDGRFHLESVMIANPHKKFFRYNPYDKTITEEKYDYEKMLSIRRNEIERAANCKMFGIILGTLGRQGSPKVLETVKLLLKKNKKEHVVVLMSEITPEKLKLFTKIDCWVQIACPRLSIDWGCAFEKPLLTPYELVVSLKGIEWRKQYPMDFYASESLGPWTPNYVFSIEDADKICGNCEECHCSDKKIKE